MTKSVSVWIYITCLCCPLQPVCTVITYTSKACYGSNPSCTRHDINCNSSQNIAIVDAYYTDNTECKAGVSDCGTVHLGSITERGYSKFSVNEVVSLYKNCSRKPQCGYHAPRRSHGHTFSVVKYRCIEKNASLRISPKVILTLEDTVVSNCTIQNNSHVCTFTPAVDAACISIYALDVRLRRGPPGQCLSQLSVLHGTNITTTNCSTVFKPFDRLNVTAELPIYLDLSQQSLIWLLINASDPFSMGCETDKLDLTTTITSTGSTVNTVFSTKDITSPEFTTALKTLDVDSTSTTDINTHKAGQTRNNTGAIAGGIVATVVAVLVVTFVSVWITRQRRAKTDANPDMTYSLAGKIPQNNYHEIQDQKTQNSGYDYATADGMVLPPTANSYFTIEPAGKQTARDNSTARTAEGEYDHIGDQPSQQTSDYDTTASVAQPGNIREDSYGYNHFQMKANPQTHQNDYDTAASATQAVAQLSRTERNTDEDDYDHFHRLTNTSETVSSPYDTTSGVEDNPDYSVAGQMK